MAPGRIHLGGIVALAALLAIVVAGCGGGSSSAPGAATEPGAAAPPSAAPASTAEVEAGAGGDSSDASGSSNGKVGNHEKKHPPLELPKGPPEKGPTRAQRARVPTADIELTVPGGLSVANTCKGKNVSPELKWGVAPTDASELAVFAMNLQPVDGKLHFDWAMAGIDPSLEGLKEGEVPSGATLGRNSDGQNKYSLCPQGSKPEIYVFAVYAIRNGLSPKPGFEPLAFRKDATRASEENGIFAVTYGE